MEAFLASFKLLSIQLPGGADENHEYLSQPSSFPAEISVGFSPFTGQNVMTEPTCLAPLSDGFHTTGLFSLLL